MRVRRSGEVRVALPPDRAIRLFTAEGEREWAPGWAPEYPDGDVSVALHPDGEHTLAEVTYDLTSIGDDAGLERLAEGFDAMMAQWQEEIARATVRVGGRVRSHGRRPGDAQ